MNGEGDLPFSEKVTRNKNHLTTRNNKCYLKCTVRLCVHSCLPAIKSNMIEGLFNHSGCHRYQEFWGWSWQCVFLLRKYSFMMLFFSQPVHLSLTWERKHMILCAFTSGPVSLCWPQVGRVGSAYVPAAAAGMRGMTRSTLRCTLTYCCWTCVKATVMWVGGKLLSVILRYVCVWLMKSVDKSCYALNVYYINIFPQVPWGAYFLLVKNISRKQ